MLIIYLQVVSMKEMNAYDDKNYHFRVSADVDNPHIEEVSEHGYTLKVLNSLDTPKNHVGERHNKASNNKVGVCESSWIPPYGLLIGYSTDFPPLSTDYCIRKCNF